MKPFILLVLFLAGIQPLLSQHKGHETHHSDDHSHFRISGSISHTYLPQPTAEGKEALILPSFGFDIEYWFNKDLGIGLHNDLELLQFEIVESQDITIEREFPVLFTLDALWKPVKDLVLFGGPGVELERTENFYVLRLGAEYEIAISPQWDVAPIAFYDLRPDAYDTFSLGISIGFHTSKVH